jgi:hypothetical protein
LLDQPERRQHAKLPGYPAIAMDLNIASTVSIWRQ